MASAQNAAPGWYPNPENPAQQRYWDGTAWTEHIAPLNPSGVAPAPRVGASPSDPVHWLIPTGRSGAAIAAGYLGLLCLLFALAALAPMPGPLLALAVAGLTISVSLRALKKIKEGSHGTGRAIFGLVCAGIAAIAGLVGIGTSLGG